MDMVIEVRDLCHSYRMGSSELKIISHLDFSLEKGKWSEYLFNEMLRFPGKRENNDSCFR